LKENSENFYTTYCAHVKSTSSSSCILNLHFISVGLILDTAFFSMRVFFPQLWKKRKKKSIDERNLFLFRPDLWVGGDENSKAERKYYFQKSLGVVHL
jgi:hypothetical protein